MNIKKVLRNLLSLEFISTVRKVPKYVVDNANILTNNFKSTHTTLLETNMVAPNAFSNGLQFT